ncbi:MAG: TetR/AcrR family transcriptional regulator [Oscillospiraceae bacterium]|nr:TetR/AcrR family transcriptional regulator [Oscillospiraceae bacterium]
MRIVKEAEERREEILDAAEKLFAVKGFDNTSTGDILDAVGIARGTLYYHFQSKEEILDGVIQRITARLMGDASEIVQQKELPVLERLTKTILSLNVESKLGLEIMEQVHRPQNALMHQKMQASLLAGIHPILTELVEEGIGQGIFHTQYPESVVEMTILYANTAFDELSVTGLSPEQRERKIAGFIYNLERLMGVAEGSLQEAILAIFRGSRLGSNIKANQGPKCCE